MNKIAIIGYGELGRLYHHHLVSDKETKVIFFDDYLLKKGKKDHVFAFHEYGEKKFNTYHFFVSLGYHHLKKKVEIINLLLEENRLVPFFAHSTSFVHSSAFLGKGTFILPMCNIDKEVVIGKGVFIAGSTCISHNNTIGDGCHIGAGVITSGNVQIGKHTFIGTGTSITNNVKIGSNVKIGIGSVVTKDIPDGCSAIGNPISILDNQIKLI